MGFIKGLLLFVEVICSFLLMGLILMQKSSGQGMGTAFGGGMTESLFGARAGNVLTKATVILATIFLGNTMLLSLVISKTHEKSVMERYNEPVAIQPIPTPADNPYNPGPLTQPAGDPTLDDSIPLDAPNLGLTDEVPVPPEGGSVGEPPSPPMPEMPVIPEPVIPQPPDPAPVVPVPGS